MADARARPVAVVTGATSGIGAAVAEVLAGRGFHIEVVSRDDARCRATVAALKARGGDAEHVAADLGTNAGCSAVVKTVRERHSAIQLLVNNAGAIYPTRTETPDGCERTFALNVRAPYRLTVGLMPLLVAGAPARVVNVASAAHRGQRIRLEDLESREHWGSYRSYGRSKLAVILLTAEMGRRIDPRSVAFFSVHPGLVRTHWGTGAGWAMRVAVRLGSLVAIDPTRAARTVVYAALDRGLEGRTGLYLAREQVVTPARAALDPATAKGLIERLASAPG